MNPPCDVATRIGAHPQNGRAEPQVDRTSFVWCHHSFLTPPIHEWVGNCFNWFGRGGCLSHLGREAACTASKSHTTPNHPWETRKKCHGNEGKIASDKFKQAATRLDHKWL